MDLKPNRHADNILSNKEPLFVLLQQFDIQSEDHQNPRSFPKSRHIQPWRLVTVSVILVRTSAAVGYVFFLFLFSF